MSAAIICSLLLVAVACSANGDPLALLELAERQRTLVEPGVIIRAVIVDTARSGNALQRLDRSAQAFAEFGGARLSHLQRGRHRLFEQDQRVIGRASEDIAAGGSELALIALDEFERGPLAGIVVGEGRSTDRWAQRHEDAVALRAGQLAEIAEGRAKRTVDLPRKSLLAQLQQRKRRRRTGSRDQDGVGVRRD